MKRKKIALIVMMFLMAPLLVSCATQKKISWRAMKGEGTDSMKMHHLHSMMNHGLIMVAEGSNMIMTSYMKMAPGVDAIGHEHGHEMMEKGKAMINRSLSGPEMMSMMKTGESMSPHMKKTHDLGEEMVKAYDILVKMNKNDNIPEDMMAMHHQHGLINHAMAMAAEGSNITMLGEMGMAGNVDTFSIDHGKMMLQDAKSLITKVMGGDAMMDMHASGKSPKTDATMKETHSLGEVALKIIDLLENMPAM